MNGQDGVVKRAGEQDEEALQAAKEEAAQRQKQLEEQAKADAFREKIERKANTIATCIRRFLASCEAMEAERRQERRQAKSQGQQKKGKKTKGGKKKGKGSPLADAWKALLDDLDEKINKQKRCSLDDIYRGVMKMTGAEHRIPDACRRGAQHTFRDNGLPAVATFESGFTVEEIFRAGYTLRELEECGARLSDKLQSGNIA